MPDALPVEARPAVHAWRVETLDPVANEWMPSLPSASREAGLARLAQLNETYPTWRGGGTPVRRRLVRTTTSYTIEET